MQIVADLLGGYWEKPLSKWEGRRDGVLDLIGKATSGTFQPSLQIDGTGAKLLIEALSGRWSYDTDRREKRTVWYHEYELYLALEDIDHTRTKAQSPQTNGICERFHKTILNEFYRVTFRKKLYKTIAELQADLDQWLKLYNEERTHQGRWCYGKTPMQTFIDSIPLAKEKILAA